MTITTRKKAGLESLISLDYMAVLEHETVGSALQLLRKRREDFQNKLVYIYVTSEANKLVGVLRVRDLLTEDSQVPIAQIMKQSVLQVLKSSSIEEALQIFRTYSFSALPVTDDKHQLIGTIPADRIKKHLSPTARQHFYRFTGFSQEEVENAGVKEIVLKRLPWLVISVSSGLVCAYILGIFIGGVESIIALILFIPIIIGLAGSVGTQSAAITNRGLRDGKLAITKLLQIVGKEIATGFTIGVVAFTLAALIASLWRKSPVEGIALGLSIVIVMTASGILGIILPITFKTLRIRSDSASGLFVLLICDMVALILYFVVSLSLISPVLELG